MVQDVLLGPVHNAPNNVFGVMDRILAPGAVARACSASTYRMQGRVVSIKGFVLVDAYRNSGHGVPGNTDASQMVRLAVPRDTNAAGQANINNTIVVVSAPATMSSQADADVAASRDNRLHIDAINPSLEGHSCLNALSQAAAELDRALPRQRCHESDGNQHNHHPPGAVMAVPRTTPATTIPLLAIR